VGSLLFQECWKRFARDEREERGKAFCAYQYECLLDARWIIGERLGSWAVVEGEMKDSDAFVARLNRWLCIKRQGRWREIEAEVTEFDRGTLNPRFVVMIHALTDSADAFFSSLKSVSFLQHELKESPFFQEMRQDSRFLEFVESGRVGV
jgi:hypothetical protein